MFLNFFKIVFFFCKFAFAQDFEIEKIAQVSIIPSMEFFMKMKTIILV